MRKTAPRGTFGIAHNRPPWFWMIERQIANQKGIGVPIWDGERRKSTLVAATIPGFPAKGLFSRWFSILIISRRCNAQVRRIANSEDSV